MLRSPAVIFAFWLCAVAFVGLGRVYDSAPPQAIGVTIAGGTLLLLALSRFNTNFRNILDSMTTERLICLHSIRAPIGAAFLVMANEGLLPELFANRAGYGDMLTAISGVFAVVFCSAMKNQKLKTTVYIVWNTIGLADLLIAVGTGIYLAMKIPDSMIWIARLPLLLVTTFVLPILFASHIIMLRRLVLPNRKSTPQSA